MPLLSEEQLYARPGAQTDGGQTAGIIAGNTDRTVQQMGRYSEENAANINRGYANAAQIAPAAVQGYQTGARFAQQQRAGEQQYDLGTQQQQMNQQAMEEQGYRNRELQQHEQYRNAKDASGQANYLSEEGALHGHALHLTKADELNDAATQAQIASSNQSVAASKAQVGMAGQQFAWSKEDRAVDQGAQQLQGILKQHDALQTAAGSAGPPDQQSATQLQQARSQLEQTRAQLAAQGMTAQQIARAEMIARSANLSGAATADLIANTSPGGQLANHEIDQVSQKASNLARVDEAVKQFHAAPSFSGEEQAAYANLHTALHDMGPEGDTAWQQIEAGHMVDTGGYHPKGARMDAALASLHSQIAAEHQDITRKYSNVPAPGIQRRIQQTAASLAGTGQSVQKRQGEVNMLAEGGGSDEETAKAKQAAYIRGNGGHGQQPQDNGRGMFPTNFQPAPPVQQQEQNIPTPQPQPNAAQLYQTNYQPAPNQQPTGPQTMTPEQFQAFQKAHADKGPPKYRNEAQQGEHRGHINTLRGR